MQNSLRMQNTICMSQELIRKLFLGLLTKYLVSKPKNRDLEIDRSEINYA